MCPGSFVQSTCTIWNSFLSLETSASPSLWPHYSTHLWAGTGINPTLHLFQLWHHISGLIGFVCLLNKLSHYSVGILITFGLVQEGNTMALTLIQLMVVHNFLFAFYSSATALLSGNVTSNTSSSNQRREFSIRIWCNTLQCLLIWHMPWSCWHKHQNSLPSHPKTESWLVFSWTFFVFSKHSSLSRTYMLSPMYSEVCWKSFSLMSWQSRSQLCFLSVTTQSTYHFFYLTLIMINFFWH